MGTKNERDPKAKAEEEVSTSALREELEHFRHEKEKVRKLVGQVGGKHTIRHEKLLNGFFVGALVVLFALDVSRHCFHLPIPLPPLFSLEIGILLVSLKIIWMVHKQAKVEHFQFWILNSIEFRLNEIARRLRKMEQTMPRETANHSDDEKRSMSPSETASSGSQPVASSTTP